MTTGAFAGTLAVRRIDKVPNTALTITCYTALNGDAPLYGCLLLSPLNLAAGELAVVNTHNRGIVHQQANYSSSTARAL